jgi:hypothetical protein
MWCFKPRGRAETTGVGAGLLIVVIADARSAIGNPDCSVCPWIPDRSCGPPGMTILSSGVIPDAHAAKCAQAA